MANRIEGLFKNLWEGDVTLWRTFWIFGACILIVTEFFLSKFFSSFNFEKFQDLFLLVIYFYLYFFLLVSIWRSANKYTGKYIWKYLAKTSVIIVIISPILLFLYFNYYVFQFDEEHNSNNIVSQLKPDEDYPYIGFWKGDCTDDFGIAVNKANKGHYSISFCGPGGCMATRSSGSTTFKNDPNYKINSDGTIDIKNGKIVLKFHRCSEDSEKGTKNER